MKRKRYRKGELVSDFLVFYKEVLPLITNSGKRKIRQGYFQCINHKEEFYLMTMQEAKTIRRKECPCEAKQFNGEPLMISHLQHNVDNYSFAKNQNWLKRATKTAPPGWFRVTRMGIFLIREDKTSLLFYKFNKTNKSGADYRTARKIENITWNRPKTNKAFYLMRLSYEYDRLHGEELINFKSDLWNRGSGMEVFQNLLIQNNIT